MSRNFGVRRNMFGEKLFRNFWHANDNEPEARWPLALIGAAVALILAFGIFIA